MLITLIQEVMKYGCRINSACVESVLSLRTYRRWLRGKAIIVDKRPDAKLPEPNNKLSNVERKIILVTFKEPEYANLPASQILPIFTG